MYMCCMDIHNPCHLLIFLQLCISIIMYHLSVLSIISHRLFYQNALYVLTSYTCLVLLYNTSFSSVAKKNHAFL